MGKGDRKAAKGKRSISSYGVSRPHSDKKPLAVKKVAATPKAPVAKKAAPVRKKA